jgi:hypothetical protein
MQIKPKYKSLKEACKSTYIKTDDFGNKFYLCKMDGVEKESDTCIYLSSLFITVLQLDPIQTWNSGATSYNQTGFYKSTPELFDDIVDNIHITEQIDGTHTLINGVNGVRTKFIISKK